MDTPCGITRAIEMYHKGQALMRRSSFSDFFALKPKHTHVLELYNEACNILRTTQPDYAAEITINIAEIHTKQNQHQRAGDVYMSACSIFTSADRKKYCLMNAALAYTTGGHVSMAAKAYILLGDIYRHATALDLENTVTALEHYQSAIDIYVSPANDNVLYIMAELYMIIDNYPKATEILADLSTRNTVDSEPVVERLVMCYLAHGDYVAAQRVLIETTCTIEFMRNVCNCLFNDGNLDLFKRVVADADAFTTRILGGVSDSFYDDDNMC